jgi:hypothetical protein
MSTNALPRLVGALIFLLCVTSSLGAQEPPRGPGGVKAWGMNTYGQLGNGTFIDNFPYSTPGPVINPLDPTGQLNGVISVAAGYSHSLAVATDGTVWAWGMNLNDQVGQPGGIGSNFTQPVRVPDPADPSGQLTGVIAVAAGEDHSLALKSDGTVWAWGANNTGQLGIGKIDPKVSAYPTPVQVINPSDPRGILTGIVAIAAGAHHSMALASDGTVWTWGNNSEGQLGMTSCPSSLASPAPFQVAGNVTHIVAIAAGWGHSLALDSGGYIYAWGRNSEGELGNGTTSSSVTCAPFGMAPYPFTPPALVSILGVAAISVNPIAGHSLALTKDGTVWGWGDNSRGQLGRGGTCPLGCVNAPQPVQLSGVSGVVAVAGGEFHSVALRSDGTVWTWGFLWPNDTLLTPHPVRDPSDPTGYLTGVGSIAAGYYFNLALNKCADSDGDGLCDDWEKYGLTVNVKGVPYFLDLPAMGADPNHKDVFVQLDSLAGGQPTQAALNLAINAFANAPVSNPDGKPGITLHVDNGPGSIMDPKTGKPWGALSRAATSIKDVSNLGNIDAKNYFSWGLFELPKRLYFPPERAPAFHYAVSEPLNILSVDGLHDAAGISRSIPASDFILAPTLPGYPDTYVGSIFMHELGHNLGLHHGGGDDLDNKPNYLSIMNDIFPLSGLQPENNLDFSRFGPDSPDPANRIPVLDENHLNETTGLGTPIGANVLRYESLRFCDGVTKPIAIRILNAPIDWDCIQPPSLETDVSANVRGGTLKEKLTPYDDWAHLFYYGGQLGHLARKPLEGATLDGEPTPAQLQMFADFWAAQRQARTNQRITFASAPILTVGGVGTVTATASSGLPVTFSSLTPAICTVSGSTVTGAAAGTCTVAADQAGNANFNPAPQVTQNIALTETATPAFSPSPGTYIGIQIVTLSDSAASATIYYTTDGTTPTTASTLYTGPIIVSVTSTIKAIGVAPGLSPSVAATGTYIITIVNNTPAGASVAVQPIDSTTGTSPVTLTFSTVTQAGISGLATSGTGPAPLAGFALGNPPTYYNLSTTAVYSGSISVCINYTGISFASPELFHYNGAAWVNVTTSVDPITQIVCGSVTSLSPFALFEPKGFAATGNMISPHEYHTAALLNNGKVLLAGGEGSGFISGKAELYDPTTGTFSPTGSLNTARGYHMATLLGNGKVLIAGGSGLAGGLASAELYDPSSGTFTPTGNLRVPRPSNDTATLLNNGTVLVVGYPASQGGGLSAAIAELYDPATGTFSTTGSLNTARDTHTAALLNNGKVLIAGGYDNSANVLASAELYDPASGTFTMTGSLNAGRVGGTATLLNNGKVLVAGGLLMGGAGAGAELCDPTTGTFSMIPQSATLFGPATLLNNGMVLFGGCSNFSLELYDPATNAISVAAGNLLNICLNSDTLLNDGRVLIAGGLDNRGLPSLSAELFQPVTLTPSGLVSITVTPATASLSPGRTQRFIARGTFSDGSMQQLNSVTWSVLDAAGANNVAQIGNDVSNRGVALAVAVGTATVQACAGSVCGSANLTVTQLGPSCATNTVLPSSIPTGIAGSVYPAVTFSAAGGTGTATFSAAGTLPDGMTFSGGSLSGTPMVAGSFPINITATDSSGCIGTQNYVLKINEGVATKLVFTTQPSGGQGGSVWAQQPVVAVEDAAGNLVTPSSASITLAITGGTGTASATLTCTTDPLAASSGVAKFAGCQIDRSGNGYTLTATATGLPSATSAAFNVTAGPPAKLAFTVQPSNVIVGASVTPAVQVAIEDAEGNMVTTATNAVTIAIGTNPTAGTLSGTAMVNPTNGVATFSNLSINAGAANYTLTASASGLTGATSNPFNVIDFSVKLANGTPNPFPVTRGTPASVQLNLTTSPTNSSLPAEVDLACSVGASLTGGGCTVNPQKFAAGSQGGPVTVMITSTANLPSASPRRGPRSPDMPWIPATTVVGLAALWLVTEQRSLTVRRRPAYLLLALILITGGVLVGCTTQAYQPTPTPNASKVTITETSGTVVKMTQINVTLN